MKKIILSFVLGILVLSFVASAMTGMAVSVSEKEQKSFSFQEKDYSVEVQKQDDGTVDMEINGETFEAVETGDKILIDGTEVEVKDVKSPWLFRNEYKLDLEVKESSEVDDDFGGQGYIGGGNYSCSGSMGKIVEGELGTISSHTINIEYISAEDVKLNVDGQITKSLSVGEKILLPNTDVLRVLDIIYNDKETGLSYVVLCISQSVVQIIDANSCSADSNCEINNVVANKGSFESILGVGQFFKVENVNGTAEARFDNIEFNNLHGSGNAYACLDSQGKLFRSQTPCN